MEGGRNKEKEKGKEGWREKKEEEDEQKPWGEEQKKKNEKKQEGDRKRGEKNLINVVGGVFGEGESRGRLG